MDCKKVMFHRLARSIKFMRFIFLERTKTKNNQKRRKSQGRLGRKAARGIPLGQDSLAIPVACSLPDLAATAACPVPVWACSKKRSSALLARVHVDIWDFSKIRGT